LRAVTRTNVASFEVNAEERLPGDTSVVVGGYSIDRGRFFVLEISWTEIRRAWKTSVWPFEPKHVA
jgi:hypothetical protein